jgi:hypothetical protein
MQYNAEKLINELYNSDSAYYSRYTLEEFTEICLAPLAFFKKKMKEPTLPSMRFRFMGTFQVFPAVIAKMLHYNQDKFNRGIIHKDTYEEVKANMERVHKALTTQTYKRGEVNFIFIDEENTPTTVPEESQQAT